MDVKVPGHGAVQLHRYGLALAIGDRRTGVGRQVSLARGGG